MRVMRRTEWKFWICGLTLAGTMGLLLIGLHSRAQNWTRSAMPRYVLLEREAVVVQSPQVVAEGNVFLTAWSPEGRNVVAARVDMGSTRLDPQSQEAPTVEYSVSVWNLVTRRSLAVWKHRGLMAEEGFFTGRGISWLLGTQTGLLSVQWRERNPQADAPGASKTGDTPHHALLLIDTARNQVREIASSTYMDYAISPTRPQVALHDANEKTVRLLDARGALGPALALPKEHPVSVDWMPDGSALLLSWLEKASENEPSAPTIGGNKLVQHLARMDAVTGAIANLSKRPTMLPDKSEAGAHEGALHVRQTAQVLREGAARHRAHPLWLEADVKSDQERTLLSVDGADAQISPRGDAILYVSQNTAWVAPLARVPREAFLQSLRAVVMSNAKQAGLGLIMYCQDYDEIFPPKGDVISPYIKNDDILDGLNYSYTGGSLKDIEKPAETVLGTYSGPGGVAIIYADGHVKWKDKK